VFDSTLYSAGNVKKTCSEGTYGAADITECTHKPCANAGTGNIWTQADGDLHGAEADDPISIDCNTYNSKYTAGSSTKATRVCLKAVNAVAASSGVSPVSAAAAVWSDVIDKSACLITSVADQNTRCAADGPWAEELTTVTQHVQCSVYNAMYEVNQKHTATRTCTDTVWGNPNVASCVLKSCATDTTTTTGVTYAQSNVYSYAAVDCATFDPLLYASGSVYRHCDLNSDNVAEWGAVDLSDCVEATCANDAFWGNSVASGTVVSKPCASYDIRYKMDATEITRTCSGGVWGAPNFAACVAVSGQTICASSGVLDQSFVGDYASVACATYNTVKYSAGTAYALCSANGFGAVDVTGCTAKKCDRVFPWNSVDADNYSEAWCPDASSAMYKGGVCRNHCVESNGALVFDDWANRIDLTTGPDAPVLADGISKCAAHSKGFPESIALQIARVACSTYDSEIYNAGTAYLDCKTGGTWDTTPNLVGCTLKQCSVDGDWVATEVLTDGTLDCNTYNSVLYVAGNNVKRACQNVEGTPTWSDDYDVVSCVYKQCEAAGWTSTDHGVTQKLLCSTYDSTNYVVDTNYAYRDCSATVFGDIDVYDCVMLPTKTRCIFDPTWPDSFSSSTAISINCDQIDDAIYQVGAAGGTATRMCTAGVWADSTDTSACVKKQCAEDTSLVNASTGAVTWVATEVGLTATIQCGTYDSALYKAADALHLAKRSCTNVNGVPTWDAAVDVSLCAYLDCATETDAQSVVWPSVAEGLSSEVQCSVFDSRYVVNVAAQAKRPCASTVLAATVDASACVLVDSTTQCAAADGFPASWVSVTAVELQCSTYSSDFAVDATKSATRTCTTGGVWSAVDEAACDTKLKCADDTAISGFGATEVGGAVLEVNCSAYDSKYVTGAATKASRSCTNVDGVATWGVVNVEACQWKDCPATAPWPADIANGTNGEVDCSAYDVNYATGSSTKAKRACIEGAWSDTIDVTDCVPDSGKFWCDTDGLWTGMWGSATAASIDCVLYDAELYSAGLATRVCDATTGEWGTVTVSGCTLKTCTAHSGFAATNVGQDATAIACSAFNAAKWTATGAADTEIVTRTCSNAAGVPTWSTPDESACVTYADCAATRDGQWAQTASGSAASVSIACNNYSTGFAVGDGTNLVTKTCTNAEWGHDNVTLCTLATDYTVCEDTDGGVFPYQFAGNWAWAKCTNFNTELYTSGDAARFCKADATWDDVVNVEVSGCTFKSCTGAGIWATTDVTTSASADCVAYDSVTYASGSVTRPCTNNAGTPEWGAVDTSACVFNPCPATADGVWAETADGVVATALCNVFDAAHYQDDGQTASRACDDFAWSDTITESGCTLIEGTAQCTDDVWGMAFDTETSLIDCAVHDAVKYQAGTNAVRTCDAGSYGTPDVSACVWVECAADGAWISTADGDTASVACNVHDVVHYSDSQQASRPCTQSLWGAVDVTACELAPGVFWCTADDGFPKTWTNGAVSKLCTELTGDYKGVFEGATTASIVCKNNQAGTAASFDEASLDVSKCTYKQCLKTNNELGFLDTNVTTTAKLACKDYSATMIGKEGTDGEAKLDCLLVDGVATWSDEVDVLDCVETAAESSSHLCSIGAGILSAACVAAAL